ncbi:MAG: TolC family protein, partial [Kofleriaceae bacterium]|nr:TolC family protein [Kofleriaceae bacterium]
MNAAHAAKVGRPRRPATKPNFIGRAIWVVGILGCLSSSARAQELAPELLTLEQCIALAHAHNPGLTLEQARLYETEAEYQVARAGLLPKVSMSAYYNQLDPDRLSPVGVGLPGVTLFTGEAFANLRVRQLVFDGSTRQTRTATKLGVDAQRAGVATAQNETAYAVALAYTRLVAASSLVKVADEGLKRQAAFTTLTEGFFRVGKIPRLDLLKAQS